MSDRTCALLVCLLVGMAPAAVEAPMMAMLFHVSEL